MKILVENLNFVCKSTGVYLKQLDDKTGEITESYICRPIYIKEVIRSRNSGDVYWKVAFYCNDGWQEETIARENIVESRITTLIRKGADVGGSKTKIVLDYLFSIERDAPSTFQHSYLGWQKIDEHLAFAHDNLFVEKDVNHSLYVGSFNIAKKGTYQKWHAVILEHLKDNFELQLALCLGYSAVVNGYINQKLNIHADTLIFHLSGNSTTGKTTAAAVAVSGFGDPKEGSGSLIQSFNGAENALTHMLANNNGVPIVCDETSISQFNTQKLVNVLYTWAKNIEKSRLNKNSELRTRSEWATTIITTGESSLVDKINQNEGIRARLFELRNLQWTKSANQSNELVHALSTNYGHGVGFFVKALTEISSSQFEKMWNSEIDVITQKMPQSKFTNRIGKKFAIITLTANLLNRVFEFQLNVEEITKLLLLQEKESLEERCIGQKVQEDLAEWLTINESKFYVEKRNTLVSEVWGRIDINRREEKTVVYILPEKFKAFLNKYHYTDQLIVLRELKALGRLIAEKEKYYTRRVVQGTKGTKNGIKVYGIVFEKLFLGAFENPQPTSPRRKLKTQAELLKPCNADIDDWLKEDDDE